jgi:hypothetical protein
VPLYPDLLGKSYEDLPPKLREFHAAGTHAKGRLTVRRAEGKSWLAALMRLPPESAASEVRLQISRTEGQEQWVRTFRNPASRPHVLITMQRAEGELLVERIGPVEVLMRVVANERGLSFSTVSARLFGKRVPSAVAPGIDARVEETADGWSVWVRISVGGSEVITYEGEMESV